MGRYFPEKAPPRDLTPEEKTRIARKFRRRAVLTDSLALAGFSAWLASRFLGWELDLLAVVLMLAAILLSFIAFSRCPCCGRLSNNWGGLGFFVWRGFECPACGFMPEWSK